MQKQGYSPSSCYYGVQALQSLARRVDLSNPELVKEYLARATFSESRKLRLVHELIRFYKWKGIQFEAPHYRHMDKLPFIPLESEIDSLISGSGRKTASLLLLLKETGMRVGEAWSAKWTDLDFERSLIIVRPEKGSNSRALKVSNRLISMINLLPKTSPFIFRLVSQDPITSLLYARRNFERQRKRLAEKLQNPRLMQIHFHTLRHFKATMEYQKTRDILHVMRLLGHRNIMHTLTYTHLVDFHSDDYICKVAKTVNEVTALIESGFEYVTDFQDTKLFRKRK